MNPDKNKNIFQIPGFNQSVFLFFLPDDYTYFCPLDPIQLSAAYEVSIHFLSPHGTRYAIPSL